MCVTFSQVTYSVTFTETGLASGTSWSVTLAGTARSSTTTSIVFSEPNGTYSFSIGAVNGYTVSPASGHSTVNGASVSESVTFTQVTYTVTFTETGLPSGTSWSVTLNGTTHTSTSNSITFSEPNGTYSFSVSTVSGYSVSPSSGQITVKGGAVQSPSISYSSTSSSSFPLFYVIIGVLVAIAVVLAVMLLLGARRKRGPQTP